VLQVDVQITSGMPIDQEETLEVEPEVGGESAANVCPQVGQPTWLVKSRAVVEAECHSGLAAEPGLQEAVTDRVRDGCGLRKERGKRAEADRERIGRASERTGSRRTWLQLVRCALVHTGVLFRKSRSDRKGNRGN